MRRIVLCAVLIAVMLGLAGSVFAAGEDETAEPVVPGTWVFFDLPDGTPITTGAAFGSLRFVGPDLGTTSSGNCGLFGFLQDAVYVQGHSGSASGAIEHRFQVIVDSEPERIPNGTQLTDIESAGNCLIAGATYNRYRGTVK